MMTTCPARTPETPKPRFTLVFGAKNRYYSKRTAFVFCKAGGGSVAAAEKILTTVEAIHAAGLDTGLWPQALAALTDAVGGIAATLEIYKKPTLLTEFHTFGVPPADETAYLADYMAINPRIPVVLTLKPGSMIWDNMVLDERGMNRDAFYADFLAPARLRYFVGATLPCSDQAHIFVSVQRSEKQGHVDRAAIARMQLFLPHVQQALDVARRLRGSTDARLSLEGALDWLTDGVALVRADGTIVHANEAMQAFIRRNDGIRIKKNAIDFATQQARINLDAAIGNICRAQNGEIPSASAADFAVAPSSSAPPYLVSVRPLPGTHIRNQPHAGAIAIVFVHDPRGQRGAVTHLLREVFGFTDAEAHLAQALMTGTLLVDYAQIRAVSLNTIYTHLRRIKEKTGCSRMTQLIRKLNELQLSLREP
jgi:DNA-binding CsgD family transcriptional regulator/PAS domain-containing protein